jgi:hypothetical protein
LVASSASLLAKTPPLVVNHPSLIFKKEGSLKLLLIFKKREQVQTLKDKINRLKEDFLKK